jgi:hypothetical protein
MLDCIRKASDNSNKQLKTYVWDNNIVDIQQEFKELPDKDNINNRSNDEDDRNQLLALPGESNDAEDRTRTPEFLGDIRSSTMSLTTLILCQIVLKCMI